MVDITVIGFGIFRPIGALVFLQNLKRRIAMKKLSVEQIVGVLEQVQWRVFVGSQFGRCKSATILLTAERKISGTEFGA
jgi:hypothetical protein